ncbi:MAG: hypothetical protein M3311_04980 [Thermoproteota archaeon]|nr:hypothetical protein [Thermoproteota archaeon]
MFGWSVFCGWDFPCSVAPDRLVLHSIIGAIIIDIVLTKCCLAAGFNPHPTSSPHPPSSS